MTMRTIKPAEGLLVRRPDNGRPLAAQGEAVEWSAYWQRRFNDGDVRAVPNTAQEQPQAEQPSADGDKKRGAK
jgi:hypothetical protein